MTRIFLTLFLLLYAAGTQAASIPIIEAVSRKLVKVKKIAPLGCYNGTCLDITLQNTSASPITVLLPPGLLFDSEKDNVQDLLMVSRHEVVVANGSEKSIGVKTMCAQSYNAGPSTYDNFRSNLQMAPAPLVALATLIAEKAYYTSTAQSLVWAVANNNSAVTISSTDPMREDACNLLAAYNIRCVTPTASGRSEVFTHTRRIESALDVILPKEMSTTLQILRRSDSTVVHTYFENGRTSGGFHQFRVAVPIYGQDTTGYVARMLANGEEIATRELTMQDSVTPLEKVEEEVTVNFHLRTEDYISAGVYDQEGVLYIPLRNSVATRAGHHMFRFNFHRELPKGKEYTLKLVNHKGEVLASKPIHNSAIATGLPEYAPVTKRGQWLVRLNEPVSGASMEILDAAGNVVWVVFENSSLGHGPRSLAYAFQHIQGPEAVFHARLLDKNGEVIMESCIVNCPQPARKTTR